MSELLEVFSVYLNLRSLYTEFMKFTLFGYPKTGKTTLFNLLTGANIETQAYDSGKKEPNLRTCIIPDERLEKLASLYPELEIKPATVDYSDLAGLAYGEAKTSTYLSFLRQADGLSHVVRGFHNPEIPRFLPESSPQQDIKSMEEELILADLVLVENRLEKIHQELKGKKTPQALHEKELLETLQNHLTQEKPLREFDFSQENEKMLRAFSFLSQKPLLLAINIDENDINLVENPEKIISPPGKRTAVMVFCGKIELEILQLENKEKEIFLKEYGLKELSLKKFLRTSFELMETITFFTIGKNEIKAWTSKRNTPAQKAAGLIHTQMEKGFIRAEVISWEELIVHGSFQAAKDKGAVGLEGKDYSVKDGDIIYFRFSP